MVAYSSGKVPLAPILEHLELVDNEIVKGEIQRVLQMLRDAEFKEDVIRLEEIASKWGVSPQAVRAALVSAIVKGYSKVGDHLVSVKEA